MKRTLPAAFTAEVQRAVAEQGLTLNDLLVDGLSLYAHVEGLGLYRIGQYSLAGIAQLRRGDQSQDEARWVAWAVVWHGRGIAP